MQWILENPWPAGVVGAVFVVGFLSAWGQTGQKKYLGAAAAVAVVALALVVVEHLIVTPREEVEQTIHEIAQALEQNDTQRVLSYLHPQAQLARTALRRVLPQVKIYWARASDIRVELSPENDPQRARVKVFGTIRFEYRMREMPERFQRTYAREVEAILVRHQGRWLVRGYRDGVTNRQLTE